MGKEVESSFIFRRVVNGKDGSTGKDGNAGVDGVSLILTPNPVELSTDDKGMVNADASCTITYKAGAASGAVADISIEAVSDGISVPGTGGPSGWIKNNVVTVPSSCFGTQKVTWADADGNEQSKDIARGSYYVDFTCACGKVAGVQGRILFQVAASTVWSSLVNTAEEYKSLRSKLYDEGGTIALLQADIDLKADSASLTAAKTELTTSIGDLQTDIDDVADAVATNEGNIATLQGSVSSLEVTADKISAKTRKYNGINILSTDSAGKDDSTNSSADATASGATTIPFYLRKAIVSGCTYRFHAELNSIKGGSKVSSLRLRYGSSTYLASAITASTEVSKGVTYYNIDFTATTDYAAGTTLYVYLYVGSVKAGDTLSLLNCALLYDLEQYMLDTGFDIFGHTFQVTADNFIVLNNEGVRNLFVDASGNLIVRGAVNNDTLWIDSLNSADYILECPISTSGGQETRSGEMVNGGTVPAYCLDLFRAPSVIVLAGLVDSSGTKIGGFLLPSAYDVDAYCRTKTTYLGNGERWITFADLRMLVGRSFTFICQGRNVLIGLGNYYVMQDGQVSPYLWGSADAGIGHALQLTTGQHLTVTMRLHPTYGYIWEVAGIGSSNIGSCVESLFAGNDANWNVPEDTSLTNKKYVTVSDGTTALSQINAGRTYTYLSGSDPISGTLLFSRCKGGTIRVGSANTYGLLASNASAFPPVEPKSTTTPTPTGGMKLRKGAKHVSIKLNNGYYPSATGTTYYMLGVRLILWDVSGSGCGTWAQSPRFAVDDNLDIMQLDLTAIFDDWSEDTQYYLAINVEAFTGEYVSDGYITPVSFSMENLGLEIVEY